MLPSGDVPAGPAFLAWKEYSQTTPRFHVGGIVRVGCATALAAEVIAAYDAPFPDDATLVRLDGVDHFEPIDLASRGWPRMMAALGAANPG